MDRSRSISVINPMDLYLIRHAHAGSREATQRDIYRPLSDKGHNRATALIALFADTKIKRILSSPATRCVQTVEPLAKELGKEVIEEDVLWEGSLITDVIKLMNKYRDTRAILCSHGDIIPGVIDMLGEQGVPIKGRGCEKGSIWVVRYNGDTITEARYVSKKAASLP